MLSQKSTKTLINSSLFLLSFIGLVDASYLTFKHYSGAPPSCSVALGCETVTSSQYAMIGEVPLALLGAFYYVTILVLCCASFVIQGKSFSRMMLALACMGFLVSAGLVYLQLAVIKAICSHCMLSAATSTGIFGLSILKLLISNSERTEKPKMRKTIQKEVLPMYLSKFAVTVKKTIIWVFVLAVLTQWSAFSQQSDQLTGENLGKALNSLRRLGSFF